MDALVYVQGFLEGSVKLATCLLYIAMLFSTSTFPIPTVQLLVTLGVGDLLCTLMRAMPIAYRNVKCSSYKTNHLSNLLLTFQLSIMCGVIANSLHQYPFQIPCGCILYKNISCYFSM